MVGPKIFNKYQQTKKIQSHRNTIVEKVIHSNVSSLGTSDEQKYGLIKQNMSSVIHTDIFHNESLQMLESSTIIQFLVLGGRKVVTSPPQVGEKLRNLNRDRLLTARLLKTRVKGPVYKEHCLSSIFLWSYEKHRRSLHSHATRIKLQPTIRQIGQLDTEGADHKLSTFHLGRTFSILGARAHSELDPWVQRGFLSDFWEGWEAWRSGGLAPAGSPPRAESFVGVETRADRRTLLRGNGGGRGEGKGPGQPGGGDTKNLGSAERPAEELPPPALQ